MKVSKCESRVRGKDDSHLYKAASAWGAHASFADSISMLLNIESLGEFP